MRMMSYMLKNQKQKQTLLLPHLDRLRPPLPGLPLLRRHLPPPRVLRPPASPPLSPSWQTWLARRPLHLLLVWHSFSTIWGLVGGSSLTRGLRMTMELSLDVLS